ncbi:hypothetical protein B7463_g7594, partial [Scytalidium lignicola]
MEATYARIFDDLDRDVNLGDFSYTSSSPTADSALGKLTTIDISENGESPDDNASPRSSIFRKSSSTLNDYESLRSSPSSVFGKWKIPHGNGSTRSLLRQSVTSASDYEKISTTKSLTDVSIDELRQRHPGAPHTPRLFKKPTLFLRRKSTFDGHFATGKPGWWKKQMLVDRSLRAMAAFTAVCAIVMMVILIVYLPAFKRRLNHHTTSVGAGNGESCSVMERRNVQLVTSLKVSEIPWALSMRGDSRIGTNSPTSINHKKSGKVKAWISWLLLISTSLPVHFLANSVFGPSFYIAMPKNVTFLEVSTVEMNNYTSTVQSDSLDSACWTALRAGYYALPQDLNELDIKYSPLHLGNGTGFTTVQVMYSTNCAQYRETTDIATARSEKVWNTVGNADIRYEIGDCTQGHSVNCILSGEEAKTCRLSVRMQAVFILSGCLIIKAIYMIALNFRARGRVKEQCLTFGDVIVASVLDPDLKVQNECLLNSGDGYRLKVAHTCHKHCKDPEASDTGDGIGHCQKCKKYNDINMLTGLPHPQIAIKYKRSLLSNLGSTAITQIIALMVCSLAMVGASIVLIVLMTQEAKYFRQACSSLEPYLPTYDSECSLGLTQDLKKTFGSWGGFSSSAQLGSNLKPDSLLSEFIAFAVSNGAQVLYSLLYLLLIYNLSLICMEREWGSYERRRKRPRCTIVSGSAFEQSYFLQLPSKIIIPMMIMAASMHWLIGQSISTIETIFTDPTSGVEHSVYYITYASYPIFITTVCMLFTTGACWWAFTYRREGFIPQNFGSIRTCCASTTELEDFNREGIKWGDLGKGEKFRRAGFSSDEPGKIAPAELYA